MKKKLALLLILSLILGILASCGNAPSAISDNASVESTAATENSEAPAVAEPESSETEAAP